ncbi:MAG: hypothetical protein ACO2ZM_04215 [Francisellaceae bacterium]
MNMLQEVEHIYNSQMSDEEKLIHLKSRLVDIKGEMEARAENMQAEQISGLSDAYTQVGKLKS